jgi:transposase
VHQVVEVPQVEPDVHEITMHGARCRDCGETTFAALPRGVPAHMFGPRLLALISYLLVSKMSRRQVREILAEVFGIPVSLGALSDSEQRVSNAVAPAVDAAAAYARSRPVKNFDGSNWRLGGAMRGLWTIATSLVTVFFVTANSTREKIEPLLGALSGFLVTDRGAQFGFWAMERRQVCWAHLIRKFVAFSERKDEGAALGEHLLLFSHLMLADWHRVRDGTLSRRSFQKRVARVQTAIENLLERGVDLRLRGVSGSCQDMLDHRGAFFTFVRERGVEPTNNHAERALRPFVLWRKTSYGSQSERGCLFAARMMTVAQTLRQQKRSVFAFLVDACRAAQHRLPTPSLLPVTP